MWASFCYVEVRARLGPAGDRNGIPIVPTRRGSKGAGLPSGASRCVFDGQIARGYRVAMCE